MPLSNTTLNTLASSPYWDDFNPDKRFHRILARPSIPLQVREFNQIQSMTQNQIEQLGGGIFKEGSAVSGGNLTFANNVQAIQIIRDDAVDLGNFYDVTTGIGAAIRGRTSMAEGRVVQVDYQSAENYQAVIFTPMTASEFVANEFVDFVDSETTSTIATMTLAPSPVHLKDAATFSVDSGTFFLRGHLVEVTRQSIILSANSSVVSARVGFVIEETIVTPTMDSSLLDPALETTNYAAPGAHRLQLTGTLSSRPIAGTTAVEQNADEDFIEIARVIDGVLVQPTDRLVPSLIEETLARRTYDESGDYVVRPFKLAVRDHNPPVNIPNVTGTITANASSTTILGAGVPTLFQSEVAVDDVLVVNGEERRVLSIASNTALVVNTPFSVAFTNTAFVVVSDQKLNLELDAGKAYVRGYEFQTLGTTKLSADRPRTTAHAQNADISVAFGPFVYATHEGIGTSQTLLDINTMPRVDLHGVSYAGVNALPNIYNASKIGTAYVRSFTHYSGLGDANTIYKLYLINAEFLSKNFEVATGTSDTKLTTVSPVSNSTGNFITLGQNSVSSSLSIIPVVDHGYNGATVVFRDVYGGTLDYTIMDTTATVAVKNVINVLQVTSNAFFGDINTTANVVVIFSDKCINSVVDSVSKTAGATVSVLSKVGNIDSGTTIMTGADRTAMVFPLRHSWVKSSSQADENFSLIRYYPAVTGASYNTSHMVYTVTVPAAEEFYPISTIEQGFMIVNATGYLVPLNVNATSSAGFAASGTTASLYLQKTYTGPSTVAVYALTDVNIASPRTKTLYTANTNLASVIVTSGVIGSNVAATIVKTDFLGHIGINVINAASSRTVSLGVADVYAIPKVYAVTDANSISTGYHDVTNRYTLDNGQRDWCYDHASLVLRPGFSHYTANQMLVMADVFRHSSSNGYFTGKSYANSGLADDYADIPMFTDPKGGKVYSLRDCVDFRPIRTANTVTANVANNPYVNTSAAFDTTVLPYPDGTFQSDYDYYLPRVDKIVLTKDRTLKVLSGVPESNPIAPADDQDGITLYTVNYPAYTANVSMVQFQVFEYRRYTMKDIGRLQKRIENLEYYVQLSVLEARTLNTPEFSADNLERFKNGILVDSFMSSGVADLVDDDYYAAIDPINRELRPVGESFVWNMGGFDANSSTNVQKIGDDYITAAYTETAFVQQPLASKAVNVNPFNVASWFGQIKLTPEIDVWFDTVNVGNISVSLSDPNETWTEKSLGTTWNSWETNWTGVPVGSAQSSSFAGRMEGQIDPWEGRNREQWIDVNTQQTQFTGMTTRSGGTETFAQASTYSAEVGERTLDISVAQFMRAANIRIEATGLKPGAALVATFDGQNITDYVERANEIVLSSNTVAQAFKVGETLTSNGSGWAQVAGITGNVLRVVDASGVFYRAGDNVSITGVTSGAVAPVGDYRSYSGSVQSSSNTTTVVLDPSASSVNNIYANTIIAFTSSLQNSGAVRRTILSYVGSTRTATLSAPVDGLEMMMTYTLGGLVADNTRASTEGIIAGSNTTSIYFAGQPDAQLPGRFYGLFRLPAGKFLIGSRAFRLTDNTATEFATTAAEGIFQASGYTRQMSTVTASTRQITFATKAVADTTMAGGSFTVNTATISASGRYIDPLAQTFLIDGSIYAQGVYLTSVDLFFSKKDNDNIPVTLQIRPTTNGYPSSDIILAEVELPGDQIVVVPSDTTPNSKNAAHRTRFTFDRPVYLFSGTEYSLVILTNSFAYEVFAGEIGKTIIGDTRVISEQPYGGSFFKSQNARTWTPEQNEDLMFNLNRAVFSLAPAEARFVLGETPTTLTDFDIYNLQPDQVAHDATRDYMSHLLRFTDAATNDLESYQATGISRNVELPVPKRIQVGAPTSLQLSATLTTSNDAVSSVYDLQTMKIITVKNVIGNGGLNSNAFTVSVPGVMTSPAAGSYLLTLASDAGSGAVVYANTNSTGLVASFYVESPGSGYIATPTVTLANTDFSTAPTITYNGETSNRVGIDTNTAARYITKRITLADGFDASDLKVYFAANRPNGTNIDVYYKVLATGDTQRFEDKNWTLMNLSPTQTSLYTSGSGNFKEYEYQTVGSTASYVSNGVVYDRFHTYAVKIVMRSAVTSIVPRIKSLRVIAFDE